MKKRMIITLLAVVTMTSLLFVGCGGKGTATDNSTETVTETNVAEVETSTQEESNSQEVITETEAVAETETPTEEPTPTPEPTEEPTPTPTEEPAPEPTPTPEPVHEHSYTETIIEKCSHMMSGTKRYTCSCGYSYEEEFFHEGDGNRVVTKEPTCTSEGVSAEHCIYCGENLYGKSIPAIEHINHWSYSESLGLYLNHCTNCMSLVEYTPTRPEGVEIHESVPDEFLVH